LYIFHDALESVKSGSLSVNGEKTGIEEPQLFSFAHDIILYLQLYMLCFIFWGANYELLQDIFSSF
jgi:hypothetical protein